jgi:hypothetical protein
MIANNTNIITNLNDFDIFILFSFILFSTYQKGAGRLQCREGRGTGPLRRRVT